MDALYIYIYIYIYMCVRIYILCVCVYLNKYVCINHHKRPTETGRYLIDYISHNLMAMLKLSKEGAKRATAE